VAHNHEAVSSSLTPATVDPVSLGPGPHCGHRAQVVDTSRYPMTEITDNHIRVALARHLGESRASAGKRAGVTEAMVRSWESAPWWADAQHEAAKSYDAKTLGKARQVVNKILDAALEDECPSSILNQAANLSRWYMEARDPAFRPTGPISDQAKALAKLTQAMGDLTKADLKALAQEPVVLGFPDDDADDDESTCPARSAQSTREDESP
jgi:hypothetical protein